VSPADAPGATAREGPGGALAAAAAAGVGIAPGADAAPVDRWYPWRRAAEAGLAPLLALLGAFGVFAVFLLLLDKSPIEFLDLVWRGAFGSWFSLQNTLQRAAPLLLTALCVAIPARLGLVIIGGEAAVALGGLAAMAAGLPILGAPALLVWLVMAAAGAAAGAGWIGLSGWLRAKRGVNETIASLVLAYIGLALFNHLVEGLLRDPASLNKPSTFGIGDALMLPALPGTDVHPGLLVGLIACVGAWVLIARTAIGFAGRVTGGNLRAAQLQGLPVQRLMIGACLLGGGCAGLAGMIEVAAVHGRANASLIAGYGWSGILIAFLARHNPLAIVPMAVLLGGLGAAGGLLQRRMDMPDATVMVLQGFIFVAILASDTLLGRYPWFQPRRTDS
jgi:simple sugar transport system permease protein